MLTKSSEEQVEKEIGKRIENGGNSNGRNLSGLLNGKNLNGLNIDPRLNVRVVFW